jgi:hypothetical protein
VLLAIGPPSLEVPVSKESSSIVDEKSDDVEIWRRYDVAPDEAPQLIVGFVETPFALSAGVVSDGAKGAAMTVVKEYVEE